MIKIDQTIWKPIPAWEKYYQVSDTGLIKSLERTSFCGRSIMRYSENMMRPSFDSDCYLKITLRGDGKEEFWKIHQLVALVFVPNPENKPIPNHLNNVRWDNRAVNLEWSTQSENIQHAYDTCSKIKEGKPINMLDLNGNFIKRYEACRHVEKDGFCSRLVYKVILGNRNMHKGFKWEYAK